MKSNCHVDPVQKTVTTEEQEIVTRALFTVWGMGCPNCAMRVRNSLMILEGVVDAYVDHMDGVAQVEFNPTMVAVPALIDTVAKAGNDERHKYHATLVALQSRDD